MQYTNNKAMGLFGHRCKFSKPIVSRYVSFTTREIIYECKCGKREAHEVYDSYENGKGFGISTSSVTLKEFKAILEGEEYVYLTKHLVVLEKELQGSN